MEPEGTQWAFELWARMECLCPGEERIDLLLIHLSMLHEHHLASVDTEVKCDKRVQRHRRKNKKGMWESEKKMAGGCLSGKCWIVHSAQVYSISLKTLCSWAVYPCAIRILSFQTNSTIILTFVTGSTIIHWKRKQTVTLIHWQHSHRKWAVKKNSLPKANRPAWPPVVSTRNAICAYGTRTSLVIHNHQHVA